MKIRITLILCAVFLGKLIMSQELSLLIHPRYFWLVYLSFGVITILALLPEKKHHHSGTNLLNYILMAAFVFGTMISLQALSSKAAALQSTDQIINNAQYSRNKRLANFTINTEDRSLQDWVTMFSINPEPDKYQNQKIKVTGFYFLDDEGSPLIAQYAVSCCIADARIIGIPLSETLAYSENTWLEIEGTIDSAEKDGQRFAQIKVLNKKTISTPNDPYITN